MTFCQAFNAHRSFVIDCRDYVRLKFKFLFGFVWVSRGPLDGGDGREGVNKCLTPHPDDIVVHVANNSMNFDTENCLK